MLPEFCELINIFKFSFVPPSLLLIILSAECCHYLRERLVKLTRNSIQFGLTPADTPLVNCSNFLLKATLHRFKDIIHSKLWWERECKLFSLVLPRSMMSCILMCWECFHLIANSMPDACGVAHSSYLPTHCAQHQDLLYLKLQILLFSTVCHSIALTISR